MPLADFKLSVAEGLCKAGKPAERKRGRPSNEVEAQLIEKRRRGPAAAVPSQDVRLDKTDHFPLWIETRARCKLPSCQAKSFVSCQKCNVPLCLNKERNCFLKFHTS
ncbi:piggyBac transposable element-derived protein 3 [Ixodes scapularis]